MWEVNVEGTRNLIHACARAQEQSGCNVLFVYCSSTEVYGGRPHPSLFVSEADRCTPQYEYGRTKVAAEEAVRACSAVRSIILRPTGVYGPGDRFVVYELMQMISHGLLCVIPGSGKPLLMFTHVDDVCQALYLAAMKVDLLEGGSVGVGEEPVFETPINVCPDMALSYREWIDHLSELLGRAKPIIHVPLGLVRMVVLACGPLFNIGKRRTFMFQPYTIERMAEDRAFLNERAKELLGFQPRFSLKDGLKDTAHYYVAHGAIKKYPFSPFAVVVVVSLLLLALFVWFF
eukprot:TRINITY_DN22958_c0_g1_i1.p1 TRINITY_DN22958_c0_g1~~TRINITY_DN22958_c0_g1_i1.p1  ORF type:complete len:309 (+),score=83.41 TRINITY_DN22958_c0_g1_i1:62-928(+)